VLFAQVRQPQRAAATAARTCWANPATVKSGARLSIRMMSEIALFVRRGRIAWYSGELYQFSASAGALN